MLTRMSKALAVNRVARDWSRFEEWKCQFAGVYSTQEMDRRRAAHFEKVGAVQPRKGKTSFKCGCPAKLSIYYQNDGSVNVTYEWRHVGHGEPIHDPEEAESKLRRVRFGFNLVRPSVHGSLPPQGLVPGDEKVP